MVLFFRGDGWRFIGGPKAIFWDGFRDGWIAPPLFSGVKNGRFDGKSLKGFILWGGVCW